MDSTDKKIMENEVAAPIGRLISQWVKKNGITDPVSVRASVVLPSCYVDDQGMSHTGPLVMCSVNILDDIYNGDDDDYEDLED